MKNILKFFFFNIVTYVNSYLSQVYNKQKLKIKIFMKRIRQTRYMNHPV